MHAASSFAQLLLYCRLIVFDHGIHYDRFKLSPPDSLLGKLYEKSFSTEDEHTLFYHAEDALDFLISHSGYAFYHVKEHLDSMTRSDVRHLANWLFCKSQRSTIFGNLSELLLGSHKKETLTFICCSPSFAKRTLLANLAHPPDSELATLMTKSPNEATGFFVCLFVC